LARRYEEEGVPPSQGVVIDGRRDKRSSTPPSATTVTSDSLESAFRAMYQLRSTERLNAAMANVLTLFAIP
jgi:hypothetical protein